MKRMVLFPMMLLFALACSKGDPGGPADTPGDDTPQEIEISSFTVQKNLNLAVLAHGMLLLR